MLNLTLIIKGFKVIIFKFPSMIISYTSNNLSNFESFCKTSKILEKLHFKELKIKLR